MKTKYAEGDIVKHTARFLQAISWYTDVPVNGKVLEVCNCAGEFDMLSVEWADGHTTRILSCNVHHASKPDYSG